MTKIKIQLHSSFARVDVRGWGGVIWKMQRCLKKPLNEEQSNIAHDDNECIHFIHNWIFLPTQKLKYTTTKSSLGTLASLFFYVLSVWFVQTKTTPRIEQ